MLSDRDIKRIKLTCHYTDNKVITKTISLRNVSTRNNSNNIFEKTDLTGDLYTIVTQPFFASWMNLSDNPDESFIITMVDTISVIPIDNELSITITLKKRDVSTVPDYQFTVLYMTNDTKELKEITDPLIKIYATNKKNVVTIVESDLFALFIQEFLSFDITKKYIKVIEAGVEYGKIIIEFKDIIV